MQTIKMNKGKIKLPPEATDVVGTNAELTVITAGDTVILKRVRPPRITEIAERAPDERPMPMTEISREVHKARRSRRARRR